MKWFKTKDAMPTQTTALRDQVIGMMGIETSKFIPKIISVFLGCEAVQLDIIIVFLLLLYLKHKVSEIEFCLHLLVEPTQLGPSIELISEQVPP
jgi:hypothetical protein